MNIAGLVARVAYAFPDRPAVVFEGRSVRYRELDESARRLAGALVELGVQRGDRIALLLPNLAEFATCYLGIVRAGAVAVSLDPRSGPEEIKFFVEDSGATVIFTTNELRSRIGELGLHHIVTCDGDSPLTLDQLIHSASDHGATAPTDRDSPAAVVYTAGTTGDPLGATLTHGNITAASYAAAHHLGFRSGDRIALALPLFHVYGQNVGMNAAFAAAATIVLHRRFSADAVFDSIRRQRITQILATPATYAAILEHDLSWYDLSSLRFEFSALHPKPDELGERWEERFGRTLFDGYVVTECSGLASYNHDLKYVAGTLGAPIENCEIRILDEHDQVLGLDELGQVAIRGPGVMRDYWGQPEATRHVMPDGWLRTGDVGKLDEHGCLKLVDRVADVIVVDGIRVFPSDLEALLARHPAVREAAIYGVPHERTGQAVCVAVTLRPGASAPPDEVLAWCRDRFEPHQVPAQVEFLRDLPRSSTGKVVKRRLRDTV